MRKYTNSEEKIEILDSQQENVINEFVSKVGKVKVSELTDEEKDELRAELGA